MRLRGTCSSSHVQWSFDQVQRDALIEDFIFIPVAVGVGHFLNNY